MSDSKTQSELDPLVRSSDVIEYEAVDAAEGLRKGVLIGDDHGAPNFAIRRFVLESGAAVPKHTNAVEHEQYVLEGTYTVGIDDAPELDRTDDGSVGRTDDVSVGKEFEVEAGDSLFIPAGTVHWYRNESDDRGAFLCAVPNGDDTIELQE